MDIFLPISLNTCLGFQKNRLIEVFFFEYLQHIFFLRNIKQKSKLHILSGGLLVVLGSLD